MTTIITALDSFLQREEILGFWKNVGTIWFWMSLVLFIFAIVLFVKTEIKLKKKIKKLEKDLHSPEMKDIRYLFRPELKKYNIKTDEKEKEHKKNKNHRKNI